MPDVDLALILADGDYLKRAGDELVGDNLSNRVMVNASLSSSGWGSQTPAQIHSVQFPGLANHTYQVSGTAVLYMSVAADITNTVVKDGGTTVCAPLMNLAVGEYATVPLTGLIDVTTARTVTVSVWISVTFGAGNMQVLSGQLIVTDLG